ncbi:MAG: TrkH family potassium uptake protein [Clostridiaceae bacterium]|nr:TrkH family potassium uptake protein [Clostridiaceae bacterium]
MNGVIDIIEFSLLRKRVKAAPTQIIVIGFASMILFGTLLLNLPMASRDGQPVGFINAIFTATSSVCVTGLVVVDTGTHWTVFGQVVIMLLIQAGGLGFMTMSTLFALLLGRRITLKERLLIQESLNQFDLEGLVRLTKNIIIVTFAIEFLGAVFFSIVFIPDYGLKKGIAFGVFHAVTSFCNAGFDLIGDFRSFTPYVDNFIININAMFLIIIGGLGFSVWMDIYGAIKERSLRNVTLHGKVVISTTIILILTGAVFIFIMEFNNTETIKGLSVSGKVMASLFQSVSPRTAGYNTLDMPALTVPTKFITIILMFIGCSPGSTAGGIKTATAAIIFLTVISVIKGKEDPEVFGRHLPKYLVYRAMSVTFISLILVIFVTILLSITEEADFMTLLFETTSAFGTVGLTLGYSPSLSPFGKIIISMTMFAGRVGPLTLVLALARKAISGKGNVKYPEDRIIVG